MLAKKKFIWENDTFFFFNFDIFLTKIAPKELFFEIFFTSFKMAATGARLPKKRCGAFANGAD